MPVGSYVGIKGSLKGHEGYVLIFSLYIFSLFSMFFLFLNFIYEFEIIEMQKCNELRSTGIFFSKWMDGWMNEWMNGWMNEWMDGWMNEWMDGWMNEWMDGWMEEWMNGWNEVSDRSGVSARLSPLWPGFDSQTRCHMWVEFVVDSLPCFKGFSPGSLVFLPP
jgi:organic anion transporter 5A